MSQLTALCRSWRRHPYGFARDNGRKEARGVGAPALPASQCEPSSSLLQYIPAIDGTLNIMRSAKNAPSVKRFLYLGSVGSVVMCAKDPAKEVITRDDWNIVAEQAVKNLDDPMIGFHVYIGSKLEAEKAAWGFMEEETVGDRPQHTAYDSSPLGSPTSPSRPYWERLSSALSIRR